MPFYKLEFYLRRRQSLTHYVPDHEGKPIKSSIPRGYMLIFTFVRGDGLLLSSPKIKIFLFDIIINNLLQEKVKMQLIR